jgi:tRNA/tmRNA/rRNA uracil-C5-methylase (TrmA/RlmC/RlmD family)
LAFVVVVSGNMNYNQQLVLNKTRLKPLTTHWKIEYLNLRDILGSEKKFFYRNKWNFRFQTAAG